MPELLSIAHKFVAIWMSLGGRSPSEELSREHDQVVEMAKIISPVVNPARYEFLKICTGKKPNSPIANVLSFPERFFNGNWKNNFLEESITGLITDAFDLGFFVHFVFTKYPTRANYKSVDANNLINVWLPESLLAKLKMEGYNENFKNVPDVLFSAWYEKEVKVHIKSSWKIGFFKQSGIFPYFKHTYYAGVYLALKYDLETKRNYKSKEC